MTRFAEFARGLEAGDAVGLVAGAAVIALFALWQGFRALKRARLVEDTPTSLVRSAAQGYCELFGYAELMAGEPVVAPLTREPCVWWWYKVERKVRSGNRSHWRTEETDSSGAIFALDDPTGRCIVDPTDAEVIGPPTTVWYGGSPRPMVGPAHGARWSLGHEYRYTQRLIPPEVQVLAIGFFETASDPFTGADAQRELAQKLADWKRDQGALKARFDANGDGVIDAEEWETARREAQREVEAAISERALTPGVHLMRSPRDGRPFILSTYDERTLVSRRRWVARLGLGAALAASAFAGALLTARGL